MTLHPRRSLLRTLAAVAVVAAGLATAEAIPSPTSGAAVAVSPISTGARATGQAVRLRPPFPAPSSAGVPAGTGLTAWPWALRTSAASVPTEPRNGMACQVFDGFAVDLSGGSYLAVDTPCAIFRRTRFTTSGVVSNTSAIVQQTSTNRYLEVVSSDFDGGPSHQRGLQGDHADMVVMSSEFTRFGQAGVEMNNRNGSASLTVVDSYFYEPPGWPRAYHVDGIQVGGARNVVVRHNTVLITPYGGTPGDTSYVSNSALGIWAELGDVAGTVEITNNRLAGGGKAVYMEAKAPFQFRGGVSISDNVFDRVYSPQCGIWGALSPLGVPWQVQWFGNTWSDGTPLSLAQAVVG